MADANFYGGLAQGLRQNRKDDLARRQVDIQERQGNRRLDIGEQAVQVQMGQLRAASKEAAEKSLTTSIKALENIGTVLRDNVDMTKIQSQADLLGAMKGLGVAGAYSYHAANARANAERLGADLDQFINAVIIGAAKKKERLKLGEKDRIVDPATGAELVPPSVSPNAAPFEGTGMPQQSANYLIQLGPKAIAGTLNEQERAIYSQSYMAATRPQRIGSEQEGYQLVIPYIDNSLFPDPRTFESGGAEGKSGTADSVPPRATVEPLTKRGRTEPNRAGRLAMVQQGTQIAQSVLDDLAPLDPADPKKRIVSEQLMLSTIFNIPYSEGGRVRARIKAALADKLRLETGAQANDQEIQNIMGRFMPTIFDNDATQIDKLQRMVDFFNQVLESADPELYRKLTGGGGG